MTREGDDMDQPPIHDPNAAPTRPPVDAEEERQRLFQDAAEMGIDPAAAEAAVMRVAHAQPLPAGYSLVEAEGLVTGAIEDPHAVGDERR
jgi:hypothetical protein